MIKELFLKIIDQLQFIGVFVLPIIITLFALKFKRNFLITSIILLILFIGVTWSCLFLFPGPNGVTCSTQGPKVIIILFSAVVVYLLISFICRLRIQDRIRTVILATTIAICSLLLLFLYIKVQLGFYIVRPPDTLNKQIIATNVRQYDFTHDRKKVYYEIGTDLFVFDLKIKKQSLLIHNYSRLYSRGEEMKPLKDGHHILKSDSESQRSREGEIIYDIYNGEIVWNTKIVTESPYADSGETVRWCRKLGSEAMNIAYIPNDFIIFTSTNNSRIAIDFNICSKQYSGYKDEPIMKENVEVIFNNKSNNILEETAYEDETEEYRSDAKYYDKSSPTFEYRRITYGCFDECYYTNLFFLGNSSVRLDGFPVGSVSRKYLDSEGDIVYNINGTLYFIKQY